MRIDYHSHVGTEWVLQGGLAFHLPGNAEMKMMVIRDSVTPLYTKCICFCPANPELFVRGENLLAQHYEINEGFPIPKTTLMSGVNLFLDYLGIARDGCFSVLANK